MGRQRLQYWVMFPAGLCVEVEADSVEAARAAAERELVDQLFGAEGTSCQLQESDDVAPLTLERAGKACAVAMVNEGETLSEILLDPRDTNKKFAAALRRAADEIEGTTDALRDHYS